MLLAIGAVIALVAWIWIERSRELFVLSFRGGRLLLVRGRAPASLCGDFRDALVRQGLERATLKAVRTPRGAQLRISGDIDDFQAQRLRNIFHTYPMSNLTAAPVMGNRSVGQLLGIAWLAWLLAPTDGNRF